MKHLSINVLTFLVAFSVFMTSCGSDNDALINSKEKYYELSNSQMLRELQVFNDSVEATHVKTRGFSKKQWLQIATADITGAFAGGEAGAQAGAYVGMGFGNPITGSAFGATIGAIIGGSYSSWLNSPSCKITKRSEVMPRMALNTSNLLTRKMSILYDAIVLKDKKAAGKIKMDTSMLDKMNFAERQMNVGVMHNVLLAAQRKELEIVQLPKSLTTDSLGNCITFTNNDLCKLVDSEIFNDKYSAVLKSINSGEGASKAEYAVKLFNEVFSNYSYDKSDVVAYIAKYKAVINDSDELTNEEKERAFDALATALYSYHYWYNTYSKFK